MADDQDHFLADLPASDDDPVPHPNTVAHRVEAHMAGYSTHHDARMDSRRNPVVLEDIYGEGVYCHKHRHGRSCWRRFPLSTWAELASDRCSASAEECVLAFRPSDMPGCYVKKEKAFCSRVRIYYCQSNRRHRLLAREGQHLRDCKYDKRMK